MLTFKSKSDTGREENAEVDNLLEFIIKNKKYIRITVNILAQVKYSINVKNEVESIVKNNIFYEFIQFNEYENEYLDVIYDFYNCLTNEKLNCRRGRFLEKLMDQIGPINEFEKYQKFVEALVYKNGELLSSRDIDTVYHDNKLELQECKASLTNNCSDPFKTADKEKFELMDKVKVHMNQKNIETSAFLITYSGKERKCLEFLKRHGINNLEVIPGSKLIDIFDKNI